jgi:NADPH-dependent 2,4-dienoyl-CoA reductase/sulfur reductase-like enzyme
MSVGKVVVMGAGAAGLTAIRTLRDEGFGGDIVLVGDEEALPYDRPPLSKRALAEGPVHEHVALLSRPAFDRLAVTFRSGERGVAVNCARRQVTTSSQRQLEYDALVVATGVRARVPSWAAGARGYHLLRSVDDAKRLHTALLEASSVLVVGAGFLGTELAATARGLGRSVTLVDALASPMQQHLGTVISQRIAALHRNHDVALKCGVGVDRLLYDGPRAVGAQLTDGTAIRADMVVVAVGSEPAVEWLQGSGLEIGNGVVCDAFCRAAKDVYAAGDVANWPSARFGRRLRLEHRMNATEQGMAVARNVLGANEAYDPVPFFWSDQYDVKIQVHGLIEPGTSIHVLWGELDSGSFAVGYVDARNVVRGILGWNAAREARKLRTRIGMPVEEVAGAGAMGDA